MNSNRAIGVHLRLQDNFTTLAQQALQLELSSFQLFLMPQNKKTYVRLTAQDATSFAALRHHFTSIYVHSSYWINLATGNPESAIISERLLKKELYLAERLNMTHLVIHPGSAKKQPKTIDDPEGKKAGLAAIATILNNITKEDIKVKILLENTAHINGCIGSDFNDFLELNKLLIHPAKIGYCLDLAHAYAYGYDITKTKDFLKTIQNTLGFENINLIHLNDSLESLGSHKDQHGIPGKGLIGKEALNALLLSKELAHIPLICELPPLETKEIRTVLNDIKTW